MLFDFWQFFWIEIFGATFDLLILFFWIIFFYFFYAHVNKEAPQENIVLLKELNKKIDHILTKIN